MFWILRRTRLTSAVAFFNAINNNNSNNNTTTENRPARKEYSRLAGEDTIDSVHNHIDNAHVDGNEEGACANADIVEHHHDGCCHLTEGTKICTHHHNRNHNNHSHHHSHHHHHHHGHHHRNCAHNNPDALETDTDSSCTDFEFDQDDPDKDVYSDDSDYDESLTCNVCDRSFPCHRQLASHKQKKRHFGCSACDSLFPSLMALEHHKEEFEHWSADDDVCTESEDDSSELTAPSEEMERLL